MEEEDRLESFVERYASGMIPWDDNLPPPELMDLAAREEPGRALDLGCGYGRSSIYLAQRGWEVDGIDFVPQAIREARRRAAEAGMAERVHFHAADVSDLSFLAGPYDLAVDIGCMHSMSVSELIRYRDGLGRLLSPGAIYLLFAHLADREDHHPRDDADRVPDAAESDQKEEARWIEDEMLLSLFVEGFVLEHAEYGVTQVEDKPPWRSAWFLYRRSGDLAPGEGPSAGAHGAA